MPIQNRDKGTAEQRDIYNENQAAALTGASYLLATIPYPCVFEAATIATAGLSGAPQYMLAVSRLTSGGLTTINLGVSTMIGLEYGSSGPVGFSGIRAAGSTLLNLQAYDEIVLVTSVANTAAAQVNVSFIVRKVQDIVNQYGLTS